MSWSAWYRRLLKIAKNELQQRSIESSTNLRLAKHQNEVPRLFLYFAHYPYCCHSNIISYRGKSGLQVYLVSSHKGCNCGVLLLAKAGLPWFKLGSFRTKLGLEPKQTRPMTRALLTMVLKGSGMIGMELPKLYHGLADFRYKSFERQSLVIQWCSGAVDRGAAKTLPCDSLAVCEWIPGHPAKNPTKE